MHGVKPLNKHLGNAALFQVPSEMHDVLRKPQMAKLYADVKESGEAGQDWRPMDEYDLVDTFWSRLDPSHNGGYARDELKLRQLSSLVADGASYPWTIDQIDATDVDDPTIDRLIRSGWLQRVGERYQVSHDRLLGYAVARALIGRCRAEGLSAEAVAELVGVREDPRVARRLAFLMMDWFHLALREVDLHQLASNVLRRLVATDPNHGRHHIYPLLPTLGVRVVPLLVNETRRIATSLPTFWLEGVVRGLASVLGEAPDRKAVVQKLLDDTDHRIRLAGLDLMEATNVPELLDRAWELHREILSYPERYTDDDADSKLRQHLLRERSFDALKSNVKLQPDWLLGAVERAGAEDHPIELAWLIASLEDEGKTWRACKAKLFEIMPPSGARSLARNIGLWQDYDEVERLEVLIRQTVMHGNMEGSACVAAMIRLNPARALGYLADLQDLDLYLGRRWLLPPLLAAIPDATRAALFNRIRALPNPIEGIRLYEGLADSMDEATLRTFLDGLGDALAAWVTAAQSCESSQDVSCWLSGELDVLTSIIDPQLLRVFATYRNYELERNLERLAERIGARSSVNTDSLSRDSVASMLLKMGGVSYGRVARSWLASASWYGRLDGIDLSVKLADDATREALLQVVEGGQSNDEQGDTFVRQHAILSLARHGDLNRLLRLGTAHAGDLSVAALSVCPIMSLTGEVAESLKRESESIDDHVAARAMALLTLGGVDSAIDQALALVRARSEGLARSAALGYLQRFPIRDKAEAQILLDQGNARHENGTINALLATRNDATAAALREVLHERWEPQLAAILLAHDIADEAIRQTAVQKIGEEVRNEHLLRVIAFDSFFMHLMHRDPEQCRKLLREVGSDAHEALMRIAVERYSGFHTVGTRRDAIRGLAAFDEATAADCAERGLRDPAYPDRNLMPSVLYELRPKRAREVFLHVAGQIDIEDDRSTASKKPRALMRAMGALLSDADRPWLVTNLQSMDFKHQLAAIRLSVGPSGLDADVLSLVQRLTLARSSRVSQEADATKRPLAKLIRVRDLMRALPSDANDEMAAAAVSAAVISLTERDHEEVGTRNGHVPVWINGVLQHPAVVQRRALVNWAADRFNKARERH